MKCNMDCFNCPYDDCMVDGVINIEEMKDQNKDNAISKDYKKVKKYLQSEKGKAWLKQYHQTKKYKNYQKEYEKTEKRIEYKKAYMKAYNNSPQRKAYLERTKDQRREYQKAYKQKKREEAKMSKLYIAYGSNLHLEQMAYRCPDAKVVCKGIIENYTLVFRGSKTGAYATIIPKKGDYVPVVVWRISKRDEMSLDRYEGFPTFYYKKNLEVTIDYGDRLEAMAYIMFDKAKPGIPTMHYLETCSQGYLDNGLEMTKFEEFIANNRIETREKAPILTI